MRHPNTVTAAAAVWLAYGTVLYFRSLLLQRCCSPTVPCCTCVVLVRAPHLVPHFKLIQLEPPGREGKAVEAAVKVPAARVFTYCMPSTHCCRWLIWNRSTTHTALTPYSSCVVRSSCSLVIARSRSRSTIPAPPCSCGLMTRRHKMERVEEAFGLPT